MSYKLTVQPSNRWRLRSRCGLAIAFISALLTASASAADMGTAITYQGFLLNANNNAPINGTCTFDFTLWNDPTSTQPGAQLGAPISAPGTLVRDGHFSVKLDFGAGIFDGDARWLQIAVSGCGSTATLSPRVELTPVPYSLYSKNPGGGGEDGLWAADGGAIHNTNSGAVGIGTTGPFVSEGYVFQSVGTTLPGRRNGLGCANSST